MVGQFMMCSVFSSAKLASVVCELLLHALNCHNRAIVNQQLWKIYQLFSAVYNNIIVIEVFDEKKYLFNECDVLRNVTISCACSWLNFQAAMCTAQW